MISSPYVSKNFIDMIRVLHNGATVKLLTRVPNEQDERAIRAIESLIDIARSLKLKLSVMCKPYLHAKFVIFDYGIALSGSVNHTSSGMYYNDEILYVFKDSTTVKRHIEIFHKLWNCPRNTTWENLQRFSGHKWNSDRNLNHKKIAKAVIRFFHSNGNQTVLKSVLCEQIARRGFNKDDVIEIAKTLRNDGVLYEPKPDMLKLTKYQRDIHDF